ncbi:hypothetical protein ACFV42_31815 [Streptomyces solisilvae]|uniref:hypothetical protein n=1 Tax=Streptomyces malaysiensis TaxID=92644 RepID=UPI0036C50DB5
MAEFRPADKPFVPPQQHLIRLPLRVGRGYLPQIGRVDARQLGGGTRPVNLVEEREQREQGGLGGNECVLLLAPEHVEQLIGPAGGARRQVRVLPRVVGQRLARVLVQLGQTTGDFQGLLPQWLGPSLVTGLQQPPCPGTRYLVQPDLPSVGDAG